jgi:hypothetical protein
MEEELCGCKTQTTPLPELLSILFSYQGEDFLLPLKKPSVHSSENLRARPEFNEGTNGELVERFFPFMLSLVEVFEGFFSRIFFSHIFFSHIRDCSTC